MNANVQKAHKRLQDKLAKLEHEARIDEGAAEFYGELNSIVQVIENGGDEAAVMEACNWVGESYQHLIS